MYRKNSNGWVKHSDFILLDLICLQLAFVLSYMLRHGAGNPYAIPLYHNMAIFILFADVVVMFFFETFKNVLRRACWQELIATLKHAAFVELLGVLYLFTIQESQDYSRMTMYLMGILYAMLTYVFRLLWKKLLENKSKKGEERSLLIMTTEELASKVIANISNRNYEMFKISGLVLTDRDGTGENIDGIPVVASMETAADYVCGEWIDEVFINQPGESAAFQSLIKRFAEAGVTVHFNLAEVTDKLGRKQFVEKIGNYTVLTTSLNYMTLKQAFLKRAMDIAAGLAGCILTGIVFLFVAPAIYIQSPGPIFFSQTRVGKNGKRFKMYKFRSMYMDAEERKAELMKDNRVKDGLMFKLEFDPRVIGNKILSDGKRKTGVGEFIRRTSLDEFPQFWNVLKGDMALIGTRPPLIQEVELYENHHHARLAVKPGITGMWQVSGRSDITDFEEVVRLDTQYVNEWSIGLDLRILFKTVAVVLKKEGSM